MKKLYKNLDFCSRDMLNFNFPEKGQGLVSPPYFVHDFSRKLFHILHPANWPNSNVWMPLLLEILGNTCIKIVCYPGCDVIKFEIKLTLLLKLFCYIWPKSQDKNLNILRTKRASKVKYQTWECPFYQLVKFQDFQTITRSLI